MTSNESLALWRTLKSMLNHYLVLPLSVSLSLCLPFTFRTIGIEFRFHRFVCVFFYYYSWAGTIFHLQLKYRIKSESYSLEWTNCNRMESFWCCFSLLLSLLTRIRIAKSNQTECLACNCWISTHIKSTSFDGIILICNDVGFMI